jgi:hypothetical protein
MIHVGDEGVARLGGGAACGGALVAGDEVAVFIGADGDVGEFLEEAKDGLGDGVLVKGGGGPGYDVPQDGEEFAPVHDRVVSGAAGNRNSNVGACFWLICREMVIENRGALSMEASRLMAAEGEVGLEAVR